jgi:hypothetical protein
MPRQITSSTSLATLRKEAKRWLKALRANDPDARARLEHAYPAAPPHLTLRDVQHALAREYGLERWTELRAALGTRTASGAAPWQTLDADGYARLASDLVLAFDSQDAAALDRLNAHYRRSFSFEDLWAEIWRRVYAFRQRSSRLPRNFLQLDEAQLVIAQDAGFSSWGAATQSGATPVPRVPGFSIKAPEGAIGPERHLSPDEWDTLVGAMKERRITRLNANGLMSDAVLARIAELDFVTTLNLGGSRELSDDGLLQLARMPQLEHLELSEYPGGKLSDRGLAVLRHLPELRSFEMAWQRGITDAGVAHLKHCDRLEQVNLMGSPTGDGAIDALQGKPRLRRFSTGRLVTDAGLPLLQNFPLLKTWQGGDDWSDPKAIAERAAHLLIDGPFTNAGLAGLSGLAGICALDLFWHVTGITSSGFAHLIELPNMASLGADGALSDNESMRHMAAMPRLRTLRAQEAAATDEGFEALSRSQTLEGFWGRVCPHFGSRGFVAFSTMPALRALGVGCANVDDRALARLPHFPALRELTPIGFQDSGFEHIGRCERLERLTCMYCRDTGDAATAHVAGLHLKYYYAGLSQITDRSLEILGGMTSLEQVDLFEVKGVTDAGVAFLTTLPRLREVSLESLPGVTIGATKGFPAHVRVNYST